MIGNLYRQGNYFWRHVGNGIGIAYNFEDKTTYRSTPMLNSTSMLNYIIKYTTLVN